VSRFAFALSIWSRTFCHAESSQFTLDLDQRSATGVAAKMVGTSCSRFLKTHRLLRKTGTPHFRAALDSGMRKSGTLHGFSAATKFTQIA
jgi:hypothetical protein